MEIKGNLNQNGLMDQLPFSFSLCLQKGKAVAALRRFWLIVDWQQGYIGSRQDALCFSPLVRALTQGAEICV